jgi:cell wall-associated NlpC family hydrolase
MSAEQIIAAARAQLGVRFQHQARAPGLALDCAGLLVHVLDVLGLPYVDERGYPRQPYKGLIKSILDAQSSLRLLPNKSEAAAGDVLLMRLKIEPQHVAIYTGKTIIHSYSQVGKVVEHDLTPDWLRLITNVYRIEPAA